MPDISKLNIDPKILDSLSEQEKKVLLETLSNMSKGDSGLYQQLKYQDFDEIPVDIETFLYDKNYLGNGLIDSEGRFTVFPFGVFNHCSNLCYLLLNWVGGITMKKACGLTRALKYERRYQEATQSIDIGEFTSFYNSHNDAECREHYQLTTTMLQRFIKEHEIHKTIERFKILSYRTRLERYGDGTYRNQAKAKETKLRKYGVETYNNGAQISKTRRSFSAERREQIEAKRRATCLDKYGYEVSSQAPEVKNKASQTCQRKYGVPYYCMTENCRKNSFNNSSYNQAFATLLKERGIAYQAEVWIGRFSYDFFLSDFNIYVEIDPFAYHNVSWSPVGEIKSPLYHQEKTLKALEVGSFCIHIFDWMKPEEILDRIQQGYYQQRSPRQVQPRKFFYNFKLKQLSSVENSDTVTIFDDGVDYE